MAITGDNLNNILPGTELADVIDALGGNDTVNALGGDDVINGGAGADQLFGGEGDDTFVEDQFITGTPGQPPVERFDGGNGFDTIELRAVPTPIITAFGPTSPHSLILAALVSIEHLDFASTPGQTIAATLSFAQVAGAGIVSVAGGAGRDFLSFNVAGAGPGPFTMPVLQLSNWSSAPVFAWDRTDDLLVLNAAAVGSTLNAAAGLNALQVLNGSAGPDTLNGSANADSLNGGGGVNQLFGNGGNDILNITNVANPNGTGGFLPATTFNGLGSTYNGGAGIDLLGIGGYVRFQGTLVDMEGVSLQSAFTPPIPNVQKQDAAYLEIDLAHLNMLPADAFFRGTGTVQVIVSGSENFNGSAYRFEAGSDVTFVIDYENDVAGFVGITTLIGTSGRDVFDFGEGTIIATGGAGADTFEIGEGNTTITDFTPGEDKLDLSDTGITSLQRLSDFIVQSGPDLVIQGSSGGETTTFTLLNVTLANLDFTRDVIFTPNSGPAFNEDQTEFDDLIFGFAGNDVLTGLGGNDRLYGGGGVDRLFGDGGNDTIILDGQVGINGPGGLVARYDGGSGFDTLELRPAGINFVTAGAAQTSYGLAGAEFVGIERIVFASTASNGILVSLLAPTIAANGPIELVGGAGIDSFVTVAFSSTGGTFTMPSFTLTNWTTLAQPYRQSGSDFLVLFAAGGGNFTLNARNGLNATQAMFGQAGNDTLNGSDGTDILNGNGGANQLFGNGGDDVLVIANTVVQTGPSSFVTTTFTGAGSTFDGGDGFDVLSVGGVVNFQGSLAGIEGIFLQRAFASPNPGGGGSQAAAYLTLYASQLASLPGNLSLDGTGTVQVVVNGSENFDGSAYRFEAGSNVTVVIDYENDVAGFMGTTTLIGTSGRDVFDFGEGTIIATGGAGADTFEIGEGNTTITDFTPGEDKLDLSGTGITSLQRLSDFIIQTGPNLVIQGSSGGETTTFTLQNVTLANLDFTRDVIFTPNSGPAFAEDVTELDDLLFGLAGNDTLHGLGGNDRIYSGGGVDKLYGDGGNDTIILDGAIPSVFQGVVLDGGPGSDTLVLRNTAGQPTALGTPLTVYQITFQNVITGFEALRFESQAGTQLQFVALKNVINNGGLTTVTGGAGRDIMVEVVGGPANSFMVSDYQLNNWTSNISDTNSDIVALVADPNSTANYTLNAREGLASTQSLRGAAGNDLLIGSSGSEFLDGRGGVNTLRGMGGSDALIVTNVTPFGGTPTQLTYAGSIFDGGDGIDSLSVTGRVDFQGTLQNIERIFFNPAFTATAPGQAGLASAHLLLSGATLAALPRDLVMFGNGTLSIDLDPGQVYDASGYVVLPGFTVAVNVTGSGIGDTITLGAFAETVDDDGGIDTAVFAGNRADYIASAGTNRVVLIGNDSLTDIEFFRFADGTYFWDGSTLVAVPAGTVADGYIANATVFVDVDGDGALDAGEDSTTTDASGNFLLLSSQHGSIRAIGGTNIDTGLANLLVLSAPEGSTVVNPLTTLIESLVDPETSAAEAEFAVETALGLDHDLDLTQLDLVAAAAVDPLALEAQRAAASVAEVLNAVAENGGDAGDALGALAVLIEGGGTVDLTNEATLTTVIAAGLPGENVTALVDQTQAVTAAINNAGSLDEITAAQDKAADDAAAVTEDHSVMGNVLANDTDASAVATIEGQAIGDGQMIHGAYGTLTLAANGTYTYLADGEVVDAYLSGTQLIDSFTYTMTDGAGHTGEATLTVTVTTNADTVPTTLGSGKSTFVGDGNNDDIVTGGRGSDTLAGGAGADRLYGGQGDDRLSGGNGFDLLVGGQGADRLDGGAGEDLLIGGKSGDILTGGAGADVFDFSRLDGTDRDTITDFQVGVDHIHLSDGLTVTGLGYSGASTVLSLSNGGSILLQGVHAESLGGLFSADLPDWSAGLPLI